MSLGVWFGLSLPGTERTCEDSSSLTCVILGFVTCGKPFLLDCSPPSIHIAHASGAASARSGTTQPWRHVFSECLQCNINPPSLALSFHHLITAYLGSGSRPTSTLGAHHKPPAALPILPPFGGSAICTSYEHLPVIRQPTQDSSALPTLFPASPPTPLIPPSRVHAWICVAGANSRSSHASLRVGGRGQLLQPTTLYRAHGGTCRRWTRYAAALTQHPFIALHGRRGQRLQPTGPTVAHPLTC